MDAPSRRRLIEKVRCCQRCRLSCTKCQKIATCQVSSIRAYRIPFRCKSALLLPAVSILVVLVGMLFQAAVGDLYGQFICHRIWTWTYAYYAGSTTGPEPGVNPIAGQTYPFVAIDLCPGELLSRVPDSCLGDVSFSAEDSSKHKPLATVSVA
jgi:hypothetical protein